MKAVKTIAVAALLITAATIGTAVAQNQSPPQSSPRWMGWMWGPRGMIGNGTGMMGPWMMGSGVSADTMCSAMAGHVEGRLGYVKAELKITDAQQSLWDTYAAAARDNASTMVARCTTMMGQRGSQVSLPDRLDQNEQLMAAQLDAVRAANKALKPLYAVLNESQKKAADELFWSPMGMM
jgi:LTXXQ motif family protein